MDTAADEERAVDAEPAAAEESTAAVVSAAAASVEHAASEESESAAAVPAPAVVSAAGTVSGKHGRKASGRRRGGWRRIVVRIGIGLAACLVLLVTVNVGCYAIKEKSFFEIVREGVTGIEITVTGNTEGFEERIDGSTICSTWEEAEKIVGEKVLSPHYLPEGYVLDSLVVQNTEARKIIVGKYESITGYYFKVRIVIYQENYKMDMTEYGEEWNLLEKESDERIRIYEKEDLFEAVFADGKCIYYVIQFQFKCYNTLFNSLLLVIK